MVTPASRTDVHGITALPVNAPWLAFLMQPPNWPMSGRPSQRKGRAAELELSRILQGHGYNVEPGRALSYGEVPDLSGLPGIHCEVKRCEALRLSKWMAQARRDADRIGDGAPVVFYRRSREPWCVVMELEDWIALYSAAEKCRNEHIKKGCV